MSLYEEIMSLTDARFKQRLHSLSEDKSKTKKAESLSRFYLNYFNDIDHIARNVKMVFVPDAFVEIALTNKKIPNINIMDYLTKEQEAVQEDINSVKETLAYFNIDDKDFLAPAEHFVSKIESYNKETNEILTVQSKKVHFESEYVPIKIFKEKIKEAFGEERIERDSFLTILVYLIHEVQAGFSEARVFDYIKSNFSLDEGQSIVNRYMDIKQEIDRDDFFINL